MTEGRGRNLSRANRRDYWRIERKDLGRMSTLIHHLLRGST